MNIADNGNNKPEKARIAQIDLFGNIVESLMLPNGDFAFGVSQLVKLFPESVPPNRSIKQLKALWGIDIPSIKMASELNSKPINIILIEDFEKLIVALAKLGDKKALELTFNPSFLMREEDPRYKFYKNPNTF